MAVALTKKTRDFTESTLQKIFSESKVTLKNPPYPNDSKEVQWNLEIPSDTTGEALSRAAILMEHGIDCGDELLMTRITPSRRGGFDLEVRFLLERGGAEQQNAGVLALSEELERITGKIHEKLAPKHNDISFEEWAESILKLFPEQQGQEEGQEESLDEKAVTIKFEGKAAQAAAEMSKEIINRSAEECIKKWETTRAIYPPIFMEVSTYKNNLELSFTRTGFAFVQDVFKHAERDLLTLRDGAPSHSREEIVSSISASLGRKVMASDEGLTHVTLKFGDNIQAIWQAGEVAYIINKVARVRSLKDMGAWNDRGELNIVLGKEIDKALGTLEAKRTELHTAANEREEISRPR